MQLIMHLMCEKGRAAYDVLMKGPGTSPKPLVELSDELDLLFGTNSFATDERDLRFWANVLQKAGHKVDEYSCFLTLYLKTRSELRNLEALARPRPSDLSGSQGPRIRRAKAFCFALQETVY